MCPDAFLGGPGHGCEHRGAALGELVWREGDNQETRKSCLACCVVCEIYPGKGDVKGVGGLHGEGMVGGEEWA